MPDDVLLTLRQLAERLSLPESTVRYYRDAFLDQIPAVGTGRRRRYPPEALERLRAIASGYAAGHSRPEIMAVLAPHDVPLSALVPARRTSEKAAHVDLLGALIERERGQHEILWQMADGLARMTEILEGQNRVLAALADRVGAGDSAGNPPATEAGAAAASRGPALPDDTERLRVELEEERRLVERLREARLKLERRAAEAEAALAEQHPRRASIVRRLLGGA